MRASRRIERDYRTVGDARDVEVETRTEESEAGKEEGRWKRRPPGGRSLASVTRLQLPWGTG